MNQHLFECIDYQNQLIRIIRTIRTFCDICYNYGRLQNTSQASTSRSQASRLRPQTNMSSSENNIEITQNVSMRYILQQMLISYHAVLTEDLTNPSSYALSQAELIEFDHFLRDFKNEIGIFKK